MGSELKHSMSEDYRNVLEDCAIDIWYLVGLGMCAKLLLRKVVELEDLIKFESEIGTKSKRVFLESKTK